ncbi:MAG: M48 family metalloprotease [Endozoicomonas sp.]|uniref:M48 family metalloprotease n=1 Tax=Endozoicomonas sp. TaxID=1892382 RepID=UPI003D9BD7D3
MQWKALALITTMMMAGCSTSHIKPYSSAGVAKAEGEENRLWHSADRYEKQLKDSSRVYDSEVLQAYLQGIMDRLYPEFKGNIRVYVLKQPVLNAFALPNGGVYVNTGLIAAMENEAQLATVLAHEGIHYINRHSMKQREVRKVTSAFATATILVGFPLLGSVGLASTVTGYSRDLEREADDEGYVRLVNAGYDPSQSTVAFEALAREAKASEVKRPMFFSTHPAMQERIEHFQKLQEKDGEVRGTETYAKRYHSHVEVLRKEVLKNKLQTGRYNEIIATFEAPSQEALYEEIDHYILAEALRLRNKDDDKGKAIAIYKNLMVIDENFAPPYKAMGLISYKEKDYQQTKVFLQKFLELEPDSTDSPFIEQYLELL